MRIKRPSRPTILQQLYNRVMNSINDVKVFGPSILLRKVIGGDANGVVRLNTRIGNLSLRPFDSDMSVLRQVFVRKDYDLGKITHTERVISIYDKIIQSGRTPIIIDAGANIGAASIWFSEMFPEAAIVSVEPDESNAALCLMNCTNRPNIDVVQAAIGSRSGAVTLKRSVEDGRSWGVQTERDNQGSTQIVTIADLMRKYDHNGTLFLVKIDIEGFEKDLFQSNTEWLSQAPIIIIELHDWMLPGQRTSGPFQKAIGEHDFELLMSGENLIYIR